MSEIIKKHRKADPWLKRDVLNNYKHMLSRKKLSTLTLPPMDLPYHLWLQIGSDAKMEPVMSDKPIEESTIEKDIPDEPIAVVPAAVDNNTAKESAYIYTS